MCLFCASHANVKHTYAQCSLVISTYFNQTLKSFLLPHSILTDLSWSSSGIKQNLFKLIDLPDATSSLLMKQRICIFLRIFFSSNLFVLTMRGCRLSWSCHAGLLNTQSFFYITNRWSHFFLTSLDEISHSKNNRIFSKNWRDVQ